MWKKLLLLVCLAGLLIAMGEPPIPDDGLPHWVPIPMEGKSLRIQDQAAAASQQFSTEKTGLKLQRIDLLPDLTMTVHTKTSLDVELMKGLAGIERKEISAEVVGQEVYNTLSGNDTKNPGYTAATVGHHQYEIRLSVEKINPNLELKSINYVLTIFDEAGKIAKELTLTDNAPKLIQNNSVYFSYWSKAIGGAGGMQPVGVKAGNARLNIKSYTLKDGTVVNFK